MFKLGTIEMGYILIAALWIVVATIAFLYNIDFYSIARKSKSPKLITIIGWLVYLPLIVITLTVDWVIRKYIKYTTGFD